MRAMREGVAQQSVEKPPRNAQMGGGRAEKPRETRESTVGRRGSAEKPRETTQMGGGSAEKRRETRESTAGRREKVPCEAHEWAV